MARIIKPFGILLIDNCDLPLIENVNLRINSNGYVCIGLRYLHRLILNAKPGVLVDHKNRNKLDCRRHNLRLETRNQNQWNRTKASHNKSGYKGVYLCKCTGRWRAEIRVNGSGKKLGRFNTPQEAAKAYDDAAKLLHGEFACTNF